MVFINLLEKMKVKEEYKYLTNFKSDNGIKKMYFEVKFSS